MLLLFRATHLTLSLWPLRRSSGTHGNVKSFTCVSDWLKDGLIKGRIDSHLFSFSPSAKNRLVDALLPTMDGHNELVDWHAGNQNLSNCKAGNQNLSSWKSKWENDCPTCDTRRSPGSFGTCKGGNSIRIKVKEGWDLDCVSLREILSGWQIIQVGKWWWWVARTTKLSSEAQLMMRMMITTTTMMIMIIIIIITMTMMIIMIMRC